MSPGTRSAARRGGHARPLTREKIATAAIEIVRAEGQDALSMRRVAAAFGVDVAALYRHVRNKDELLDEAGRLASERIELEAPTDGDVEMRFLALSRAIRDRVVCHPELGIHSDGSAWATPFFARANGLVAGLLHEAGLSGETLVHATQSTLHLVISIAQSEVLKRDATAAENRAFGRTIRESLPDEVRDGWPETGARTQWTVDFDAFLDFALRALWEGFFRERGTPA